MPQRPFALPILLFFALTSQAQIATPHDRLLHATEETSLDKLNARPWHAKLAITAFDHDGKNPVEGTIEYWKSGEDWLRTITLGDSSATFLRHDGKSFHAYTGKPIPTVAGDLFDSFLHAGPQPEEIERATLQVGKQNFGKISLDCVMLKSPMKNAAAVPIGLYPTFCFDPNGEQLRVMFELGGDQLTVNKIGRFLDHDVPLAFGLGAGGAIIGTAKVVSMATFAPTQDTFLPTPQMTPVVSYDSTARISSGVMQSMIVKKVPPVYPVEARMAHLSGTVVLRAIIDTDGRIRSLRVISTPDTSLAIAALAAVRQWTYKPYILNGEPSEVDTTVVVNFNLSP